MGPDGVRSSATSRRVCSSLSTSLITPSDAVVTFVRNSAWDATTCASECQQSCGSPNCDQRTCAVRPEPCAPTTYGVPHTPVQPRGSLACLLAGARGIGDGRFDPRLELRDARLVRGLRLALVQRVSEPLLELLANAALQRVERGRELRVQCRIEPREEALLVEPDTRKHRPAHLWATRRSSGADGLQPIAPSVGAERVCSSSAGRRYRTAGALALLHCASLQWKRLLRPMDQPEA